MIKIAINGFGRIGRNILSAFYENTEYKKYIKIVAINDLTSIKHSCHLLKYDSVHGRFVKDINISENNILIDNDLIKYYSISDTKLLPWKELDIDLVLDCTGRFTSREKAYEHINSGAKRVLISAPCDNADKTIVYGVNEHLLDKKDIIVSNASCTTNCLAPILSIINSRFNIESGLITTIHSYTGDQNLIDSNHSDLFRARAANLSMIPSKTGAAKAIGLIIPELNGIINGMSIRVPTPNVSLVDLTCTIDKEVTEEDINKLFKEYIGNGKFKNIVLYNEDPLVSIDFNHTVYSSIFDANHTMTSGKLIKVMAWYDNEFGFSNRMLDVAITISKL